MIFLNNIRDLRKEKKISQKIMAKKLNISQPAYQKIESGENMLSVSRFLEICEILEVDNYNSILPAINADVVEEIQKVLINGSSAFKFISTNSMYSAGLVDDLIEKVEEKKVFGKRLEEELEHIKSFLEVIRKESDNSKYRFGKLNDLMNNI